MIVQETEVRDVPLDELVMHPRCQMRAQTSWVTVQEYAEAMEGGAEFPPVVVYTRQGDRKYVADGWHRVLAAKKAGRSSLSCEVRDGTLRDAMIHAAGANQHHGLRRSNEDKRRAVEAFLKDREWKKWNSAEIARRAGVSAKLVDIIRERLGQDDEYRLQFNGRGELQWRRSKNEAPAAPDAEAPAPSRAAPPGRRCPLCGHPLPPKG